MININLHCDAILWTVATVQVLGLLSTAVARLSEGSCSQTACHCLFYASLLLVGLMTLVALTLGLGCWLLSGVVFSLMVLAATWDPRPLEHSRVLEC